MHSTDIIRALLDLIDNLENHHATSHEDSYATSIDTNYNEEDRRLKQIIDLLSRSNKMYDNSPDKVVATINAVTTDAGGGWNGPKNPADMRSDSVSLYPNHIHKPGA